MARTKQEVRDFLNSQVGQSVNAKSGIYRGQCVSLIKALLEFLGVPEPYKGRGNAITVNDYLLNEGVAKDGRGWLTVVVNRSMGRIFENGVWNNYGHIWIDLQDEANYEQNGARALFTTKNTRPYSQGQQFVNLDKYIKDNDEMPITKESEMSEAYKATGSYPGSNYSYPFVGTSDWDAMLTFWQGQMRLITRESERALADRLASLKAGRTITNYIGKDYNSPFVGRPEVYYQKAMEDQWIEYINGDTNLSPGNAKPLEKGLYQVK